MAIGLLGHTNLGVLFADGEPSVMPLDGGIGRNHICGVQHILQSTKMAPIADGLRYIGVHYYRRLTPLRSPSRFAAGPEGCVLVQEVGWTFTPWDRKNCGAF